ncbi:MAG: stage IV sporulation protein A, partial [Clostridia bacterium]|nr:stage IV sporulation protein A [Clostridia bacterium]
MEGSNIYHDIAMRNNGDVYIGVVGPVRTGKSTFIKKFMDTLVIPNMTNVYQAERTRDELPQSAAGRTIMTTEPKFIPNEAVEISPGDNANMRVRMIDCVGYIVDDSLGYNENGEPRMVNTPWFDHPIPFNDAAELGTKKVIPAHSTIGLLVTTDGSFTELPRESYTDAEARVVAELQAINKPFIILLNSAVPESEDAV